MHLERCFESIPGVCRPSRALTNTRYPCVHTYFCCLQTVRNIVSRPNPLVIENENRSIGVLFLGTARQPHGQPNATNNKYLLKGSCFLLLFLLLLNLLMMLMLSEKATDPWAYLKTQSLSATSTDQQHAYFSLSQN